MSAQMNDRQLLQAVNEAMKNEARSRAQFWHLGLFNNTPAGLVAARLALATIVGDDVVEEIPDTRLRSILLACGSLRGSYAKTGNQWDVTDDTAPLDIPRMLPGLIAWEYDRHRAMIPIPANDLGKVVVAGMNAVRLGQPVRKCGWCQSVYIALRSDALFCAPQCRTNHGVRAHRERMSK